MSNAFSLIALMIAASIFGAPEVPEPVLNLVRQIGIKDNHLSRVLSSGKPLVKVLPKHGHAEIAIAGAERIRVPLEFFLNVFRATPTLKRGSQVVQIHEFSNPQRAQDLAAFQLKSPDIQALPGCSPGDCSVKLSASMMDQFQGTGIEGPAAPTAVQDAFDTAVIEYLKRYLSEGDAAMITYADKLP